MSIETARALGNLVFNGILMDDSRSDQLIDYLSQFVSDHKKKMVERVLQNRTKHITIVLEDIFKSHNANAVVRSCEAFGIQNLHVIENKYKFDLSTIVAQGSFKWIDIYRYADPDKNNLKRCYERLKDEGYKIVATVPQKKALSLNNLKIDQKLAIIFGSELDGLSRYAREKADERLNIPMYGFSQSFNLSVSVAICLYDLLNKLRTLPEKVWRLSEEEKKQVKLEWFRRTVRASEALEKKFLSSLKKVE